MFVPNLNDLRELALSAFNREACSPLGPHRGVLLSSDLLQQLRPAADREPIVSWLTTAPCPVIGIGSQPEEPDLFAPCDVVASSELDLSTIIANLERSPQAAMVLVQVLRATSGMPIVQALTVESLAYGVLQAGPEYRAWLETGKPAKPKPAQDDGPPVLIERRDQQLDLRLNRPSTLNALSVELRDAVCEALQLVLSDTTIHAVTMSGEGRCFSIGGDLSEFGEAPDPATAHAVRSVRLPAFFLSQCADRVEVKLHGACIGAGVELPAFARRVTAAKDAFFQLPELRFGLIPGAGGCVSLPRRIGRRRTAYMALTARRISAAKALQWGLVDALSD
jgi:enoyl-CoA hydratase